MNRFNLRSPLRIKCLHHGNAGEIQPGAAVLGGLQQIFHCGLPGPGLALRLGKF
jgi:hypothetical protein